MMKQLIFLSLWIVLFGIASCGGESGYYHSKEGTKSNADEVKVKAEDSDFISGSEIDDSEIEAYIKSDSNFINMTKKIKKDYVVDKSKIPNNRNDLSNMKMVYSDFDGSKDVGLIIPGFGGLKLNKNERNINIYYIETKVVYNKKDTVVYGCGYSLHYLFKKIGKGIDVSNIPSVAASVQLNNRQTQVYLSLQSYGIIGINLVKYFKPSVNKSLNVEEYANMKSSLDGIHNILGDSVLSKSVKFTPVVLGHIKPYQVEQ